MKNEKGKMRSAGKRSLGSAGRALKSGSGQVEELPLWSRWPSVAVVALR